MLTLRTADGFTWEQVIMQITIMIRVLFLGTEMRGEIRIKFMYINSEEWDYCIAKYKVFINEEKLITETSMYFDNNGKTTEILSDEKLSFGTETPEEAIYKVFIEKMN